MKEIKTVICPIERPQTFDEAVNKLLADGWELKQRSIINRPGEYNDAFNPTIAHQLYAELEKDLPAFEEITL